MPFSARSRSPGTPGLDRPRRLDVHVVAPGGVLDELGAHHERLIFSPAFPHTLARLHFFFFFFFVFFLFFFSFFFFFLSCFFFSLGQPSLGASPVRHGLQGSSPEVGDLLHSSAKGPARYRVTTLVALVGASVAQTFAAMSVLTRYYVYKTRRPLEAPRAPPPLRRRGRRRAAVRLTG